MKKKTILITGSSGFIGNFFLKSALKKGYYVFDILRISNKKNKNLNQLRKEYSNSYKSFFFSNFKNLKKKLESKKFDYFINFATLYKNSHSNQEIPNFIESNIIFPSIVSDLIFKKTKKIINFGTMMQHNNGRDYIPKNFYASTKSAFEMILSYYKYANKNLKLYNLKFFESFSETDKRKKLIPTLLNNFKKNKTTQIISSNLELNIVHVDDIIKAIYIVLNNNVPSGSYCLKNSRNLKIKQLISNIIQKSQKKLKIRYMTNKINMPQKSYLKSLPKWKPDIRIKDKIENQFYNENNKN